MKLSKKIIIFSLGAALLFSLAPLSSVWAQDNVTPPSATENLPDLLPACAATGACRVCDIVNIFITLGRWLIAGAAGLALLVIVFAGSSLVMSAGNADKIGAAKKQIVGAVVGLVIVLIAFQVVAFIIFALTTPADSQNFAASQVADTGQAVPQNLGSFLTANGLGVPWWKICDANDLIIAKGAAAFPSTANCAYWGDGTSCAANAASKCCQGKCQSGECVNKALENIPGQPTPGQYVNLNSEDAVRNYLAKGGIAINRDKACTIPRQTECTSVLGLSKRTLDLLILANSYCNKSCIIITGGTEKGGHSANTNHGNSNTVDVDVSAGNNATVRNVLQRINLREAKNFTDARNGTAGWYVCDEGGNAVNCDNASHLHVEL